MFSSLFFSLMFFYASPGPVLIANSGTNLEAAVASTSRPEEDRQRDALRKPAEVLSFFGIEQGMTVIDFAAGKGYYTHILSKAAGPNGKVIAQNAPFVVERFVKDKLQKRIEDAGLENVLEIVSEFDDPQLPGQADAVLMVLFYHDTYWQNVDRPKMNKALFDALKPGGIFGLIDHSAEAGSGDRDVKTLHRVDQALVKKELLAAGFEFVGESDLLKHPEDSRDWPFFKDIPNTRDRTDRFIFLFRKPK